jgi:hypothetical protein
MRTSGRLREWTGRAERPGPAGFGGRTVGPEASPFRADGRVPMTDLLRSGQRTVVPAGRPERRTAQRTGVIAQAAPAPMRRGSLGEASPGRSGWFPTQTYPAKKLGPHRPGWSLPRGCHGSKRADDPDLDGRVSDSLSLARTIRLAVTRWGGSMPATWLRRLVRNAASPCARFDPSVRRSRRCHPWSRVGADVRARDDTPARTGRSNDSTWREASRCDGSACGSRSKR